MTRPSAHPSRSAAAGASPQRSAAARPSTAPRYEPVVGIDAFAEALAVPPVLHLPLDKPVRGLVVGPFALPLATFLLRYTNTTSVVASSIGHAQPPKDRRMSVLSTGYIRNDLAELPADWRADVAAVTVAGDPVPILDEVRFRLDPDAILVVAVDNMSRGRVVKDALRVWFRHVLPYREHTPEPALFLMASNRAFGRPLRPCPENLRRLSDRYMSSLFVLAKDEYRALYGSATS